MKRLASRHIGILAVALFCIFSSALQAQVNVTTYHNDNARTGQNTQETILTLANVNSSQFGKLFSVTVDGWVYAQPLYLSNVTISGGTHNVLYVATEHDSLYAIDSDSGTIYWQTSLIPSGGSTVNSSTDLGCGDLVPEVGITGTPVIDTSTGTIYLVAKSKVNGNLVQYLHAIDVVTKAEKFGGPVLIQATVPGTASDGNGTTVSFSPHFENQRPGLLLENGHVVIGWSAHCDISPWHGWIMSYSASTLTQEAAFNTSADGSANGVWMSGGGLAADSNGNIYFATGNGTWNGTTDYGDSIVKLGPPSGGSFPVVDYFTPYNQNSLGNGDTDVGSGGLVLLPNLPSGQQLLTQMGKEGKMYLIDRNNMGKYCVNDVPPCNGSDPNIVQEIPGATFGVWGTPAYWNGSVYWGSAFGGPDYLKAFSFNANNSGLISTSPTSESANAFFFPAPSPTISANGNSNGILWGLDDSAFGSTCSGGSNCQVLYAYDATNLANMLYNSSQAANNRDVPGGAVKFATPMVANGKVYVGSQLKVSAYGAISAAPTVTGVSPNNGPAAGGTAITISGTNFVSGATATLGGAGATNVVVVNSTTITAKTAAHAAGAVTVTVTNPDTQSGSLTNGFTYTSLPAPTVTGVNPNNGPAAGGTAITISGTNFVSGATATLGGTGATNVVVVNSTTITATTAAHATGAVTVTVTNPDTQSGSLTNGYTYTSTSGGISFVQVSSGPSTIQSSNSSVSVAYGMTQTAGDLNIVVVGWGDNTSTISSVTDSLGNSYSRAVGPTSTSGLQQSIYYAKNIVGGNNTVTVTFNRAAAYPDVRILEYSGLSTSSPLDVTAAAVGSGSSASSGSATTTSGNELIFGAGTSDNVFSGAGSGFTKRIVNIYGNLAEDKVVSSVGGYAATAINSGNAWVMQMATFKAASLLPAPTVTGVSPNNGPAAGGTAITISGTNFVSGATATLGGAGATNVVVVNSTTITAKTAAHAAGAVTVTVTNPDTQSGSLTNGFTYTSLPAPTVTGVNPNNGPAAGGTAITISGTNFVSGATATLGGTGATNVVVVNSTTITATTAAHATGAVTVTVTNPDTQSGSLTNGYTYTSTSGGISFVQVSSGPSTIQSSNSSVSVAYGMTQTAGDLNIVVVGWGDNTSTISSVTDSLGNSYSRAVGPTSTSGLQQSIYYAKNIVGGNNTVTVTFNRAAAYPDVRILEYSGLSTSSPLDVTAAAVGSGSSASSGSATTTSGNELIFGAGTSDNVFSGAGSGFTKRIVNIYGNLAEDKVVSSVGGYAATAINSGNAWVMQMATFK